MWNCYGEGNKFRPLFFWFFLKKFLADTCPFLGPLVPLFWISGDVSSGFQSQSGFCLIRYFCGGECNVHSQDSPLVLHLPTSWQPARGRSLPHMHVQRWDLARF